MEANPGNLLTKRYKSQMDHLTSTTAEKGTNNASDSIHIRSHDLFSDLLPGNLPAQ